MAPLCDSPFSRSMPKAPLTSIHVSNDQGVVEEGSLCHADGEKIHWPSPSDGLDPGRTGFSAPPSPGRKGSCLIRDGAKQAAPVRRTGQSGADSGAG